MRLHHPDARILDNPPRAVGGFIRYPDQDVVEPLTRLVYGVWRHNGGFGAPGRETPLLGGPPPRVEHAVGGDAVLADVEGGGGDGHLAGGLGRVVRWAKGGGRVEDAPGIVDGSVGCYNAVGEGEREHVEVAKTQGEVTAGGSGAEELGEFPGLGGTVAVVGVLLVIGVAGVELGAESQVRKPTSREE